MFDLLDTLSIQNKYLNLYKKIILNSQKKEYSVYTEQHHIVPKSIGGDNQKTNLVTLQSREHFLCHLLLVKFLRDKQNKYKMLFALNMMRQHITENRYFNQKLYEKHRIEFQNAQSEVKLEFFKDPIKRESVRNKRKQFWENNPEKKAQYIKNLSEASRLQDRSNMNLDTLKLKGDQRTPAQKLASKNRANLKNIYKTYNNGIQQIMLKQQDIIPEGYVRGSISRIKIYDQETDSISRENIRKVDNIRYFVYDRNKHDKERVLLFTSLTNAGYKILERYKISSNSVLRKIVEELI